MSDLDHLIVRAQGGDRAAFEEVVRATARGVRAYVALHVADLDVVDDLAQETFLHLFHHLDDYTPGTSFRAYLKTIARYRVLSWQRSRQRKRAAHESYAAALRQRLAATAEGLADDERDPALDRLARCLERLPPTSRELVELRYFRCRPVQEVARSLGRSPGSVSTALSRIRAALADCIEGRRLREA